MNIPKYLITLISPFILIGPLAAQDDSGSQYLFDLHDVKLSGFGSTLSEFSAIDGNFAVSTGCGGAFLFNYTFYFGFYSLDLNTRHAHADIYPSDHDPISNPQSPLYPDLKLSFENNGIWLGYINSYKKLVHWGANIKIGTGTIALYDNDFNSDSRDPFFKDNVFVANPEIECEVNLTRWFKVNMGIGYRFVAGINDQTFTNTNGEVVKLYRRSQYNSPFATVKLMFGLFAKRNRAYRNTSSS